MLSLTTALSNDSNQSELTLIMRDLATKLFNNYHDLHYDFYEGLFTQYSKEIVMPLLINDNHWSLIIINTIDKTFSFINPYGRNNKETQLYFKKFRSILGYSRDSSLK